MVNTLIVTIGIAWMQRPGSVNVEGVMSMAIASIVMKDALTVIDRPE